MTQTLDCTGDERRETTFEVAGMDCGSCAAKIETALRRLPEVARAEVSLASGRVHILHTPQLSADTLQRLIAELGFTPLSPSPGEAAEHTGCGCGSCHCTPDQPAGPTHTHAPTGSWWRSRQGMTTLITGFAILGAALVQARFPDWGGYAFLLAVLVGLVPVARRAWISARHGTWLSIETLMTLAAVAAVGVGAHTEAAMVLFLFQVGEALEGLATRRSHAGIRALADLVPDRARREGADGTLEEVPARILEPGDLLQVRPGDRIPADGVILSGHSGIDESPISGESLPVDKGVGDSVCAGTINTEQLLRIRVTRRASENTIARIVRLVREAQDRKAPTARFIERFARIYTPLVVLGAALVACVPPLWFGAPWSEWIYRGAAMLLIGCPCALVISTPAAISAGLASGARHGLLMKGGAVLEALHGITTVAFDKTGTLTHGRPRVTDVLPVADSADNVISLAAALSRGSSHPLSRAILDHAEQHGLAVPTASEVTTLPGKGVHGRVDGRLLQLGSLAAIPPDHPGRAELEQSAAPWLAAGKSLSVLRDDTRILGMLALQDQVRADAERGLRELRALGIDTVMLTGDHPAAASAVAGALGMQVHAGILPQEKLERVRQLQAQGRHVAKVGDGINDAPALAGADVGIAMGGGTEVALETADAASLYGRVSDVAAMIRLSHRTIANIHQNVAIALGLKGMLLVTTLLGWTGLWPAVLADTGATVLVTANALRLLRYAPLGGHGGSLSSPPPAPRGHRVPARSARCAG